MKNYVRNLYCGCGVLAFSAMMGTGAAFSATTGCIPGNCDGYTKTAAECSGKTAIKCPFDTSKHYCGEDEPECPAVTVGEYDTCTKYCETDSKICIEKVALTCKEFIEKNNGILVAQSLPPVGTMENSSYVIKQDLYLVGEVRDWTSYEHGFTFDNINVYDAGESYAECKGLMESPAGASLTIEGDNFKIANSVSFHVPANVKISHDESFFPAFTADFWKESHVWLDIQGALSEIEWPKITFHGKASSPEATKNLLYMSCGPYIYNAGSEKTSYCGADISFSDASVDVCQSMEECYSYANRWCSWRGSCSGTRGSEGNASCDFSGEACSINGS